MVPRYEKPKTQIVNDLEDDGIADCMCSCHDDGDCGKCGCHIVDEVKKHCGCLPEAKVWCSKHIPYGDDTNETINKGLDELYGKDGHWGYDKKYINDHFYTKYEVDLIISKNSYGSDLQDQINDLNRKLGEYHAEVKNHNHL